ncbi:MAG: sensor histidine kinase [Bacteroidota bacterium]
MKTDSADLQSPEENLQEISASKVGLGKLRQESFLRLIEEFEDYAIFLLDPGGIVTTCNKGVESIEGYLPEEVAGKNFRIFYSPEDRASALPDSLLATASRNGKVNHEGWRLKKDGSKFWSKVVIAAIHDDEGELGGFLMITRDLTIRKLEDEQLTNLAEELTVRNEELRQSEERYHRMISEIQDYAIILLNEAGEIQNWNTGAEYINGYKAFEVIGQSFKIFYTHEDRQSGLGNAIHEGWRVRKDGSKFWGSVVITALHNDENRVIGFSKVTRDLTDKKRAEDSLRANAIELDRKNKSLEQLNLEVSSFAYVASHDLKEPLRKIQTYISRLEEVESPEKGKDFIEKIMSSAVRMQNLIDDLLEYSMIDNDLGKFQMVDLNQILAAVMNELEVTITEKNAIIESAQLPVIEGISFQLHQLFLNLITNSIKFARRGQRPLVNIDYRCIESQGVPGVTISSNTYHHISVRDNGIGFESIFAAKIFAPFQRLHPKNIYSGTGIGLAIVKKVVENHAGIVVAEGKPNQGAVFHLYLPAAPVEYPL